MHGGYPEIFFFVDQLKIVEAPFGCLSVILISNPLYILTYIRGLSFSLFCKRNSKGAWGGARPRVKKPFFFNLFFLIYVIFFERCVHEVILSGRWGSLMKFPFFLSPFPPIPKKKKFLVA